MRYFWILWKDMMSRSCGDCLGIYGAIEIWVASQSSNAMNIPFKDKWIYAMKKKIVAWRGWIKGRFWERSWESWSTWARKENMPRFQVQRVASN